MSTSTGQAAYAVGDQTSCANEYATTASDPRSVIAMMREGILFYQRVDIPGVELDEIGLDQQEVQSFK